MLSATLIILIAFVAQAHVKELPANHTAKLELHEDHMDKLVDKFVDKLLGKFANFAVNARSLHDTDLDETSLSAIRTNRVPVMASSISHSRFPFNIPRSSPFPVLRSSLSASLSNSPRSLSILHAHREHDDGEDHSNDNVVGRRTAGAAAAVAAAAAAVTATRGAAAAGSAVGAGGWDYVILGGGNAAGYAARELVKQLGTDVKGKVLMIGAEPVVPYERPALTKAYLHPPGAKVRARLPGFHTTVGGGGERQTPEWYDEKGISVRTSTRVSAVDAKKKTVTIEGTGEVIPYGKLLYCTGASANKAVDIGIREEPTSGLYYVREEADASALVKALEDLQKKSEQAKTKGKVVLIGGGYIGLEGAAAASGWGFDTTVVSPGEYPLSKIFPKTYGEQVKKRYDEAGVKFMFNSMASSFKQNTDGSLSGVVLRDGTTLPADLAILGIGAKPNVDLLSGQVTERMKGILVDDQMRTSDPNIYAFGDVATFPLGDSKNLKHLEHVAHARQSATHAVQAAVGAKPGPYKIVPYFYSRIFEYTDSALAWHLWGEAKGKSAEFKAPGGASGEVWVDQGKVVGALVLGVPPPSKEDMDLAKGAVAEGKAAKSADDAAVLLGGVPA